MAAVQPTVLDEVNFVKRCKKIELKLAGQSGSSVMYGTCETKEPLFAQILRTFCFQKSPECRNQMSSKKKTTLRDHAINFQT